MRRKLERLDLDVLALVAGGDALAQAEEAYRLDAPLLAAAAERLRDHGGFGCTLRHEIVAWRAACPSARTPDQRSTCKKLHES